MMLHAPVHAMDVVSDDKQNKKQVVGTLQHVGWAVRQAL
jgi:hypothetical protein